VWAKKASASEPLMTCRNRIDDIETGLGMAARDEPGGSLPTGQAVSGMEVARAWSGLRYGTWEPVAPRPGAASGAGGPAVVRGRETPKRLTREGLSTDAEHRGGPPRGSDEGPVMGLERRGRVILAGLGGQPRRRGRSR
jgi:hypothetical protein